MQVGPQEEMRAAELHTLELKLQHFLDTYADLSQINPLLGNRASSYYLQSEFAAAAPPRLKKMEHRVQIQNFISN